METATFRDAGIESPVVFTHLPATRLRQFDGVVLLGCDAEKLPARGADGLFFNQSVRTQLGLPTREQRIRIELADVAALLAATCDRGGEMLVTWQHTVNGEEHQISPWFDLLQTLHLQAYGHDLLERELAARAEQSSIAPPEPAPAHPTVAPTPTLPAGRVPDRISASGYNSLMGCPYQYYARHVLKLNDLDEVQLEMEKRDFGDVVHDILLKFHEAHPRLGGNEAAALEQTLRDISNRLFAPMLKLNYLSHAWKLRWEEVIPGYIAWQMQRETEGWRWLGGETGKQLPLALPNGQSITLHGKLDRMDNSADGLAVLDYKTRSATALRSQLKQEGEDVQLPVYALLAQEAVKEAGYLSLDKEVKMVPLQADLSELCAAVAQRLTEVFSALHAGAPLPAQGADAACNWCEVQGLCRRAYFIKRSVNG